MLTLSRRDARRLALASQGLHRSQAFGRGLAAAQRCIEQLGYLQIDSIAVLQRAHHHTLWSRVPGYRPGMLDQLQQQGRIFEYWAHAAAYLPMRDFRYSLPYMHAIRSGQRHWRKPDPVAMREVLARVRDQGPLMARDFENPKGRGEHWGWNWKPAKIALEQLFIEGQLMVRERRGFQKVYDLPERVLPADVDITMPSDEAFHRHLILSTLRAHGLATAAEFSYLRKGLKNALRRTLEAMCEAGEVMPLKRADCPAQWYALPAAVAQATTRARRRQLQLLSPFDNAVIKRKRIQLLFDSAYQLECYVPPGQRRFGYFCLPILYDGELVGRLDPKADQASARLIIHSLHLEKPLADSDDFVARLSARLRQLAAFNACSQVCFSPAPGDRIGQQLAAALDP